MVDYATEVNDTIKAQINTEWAVPRLNYRTEDKVISLAEFIDNIEKNGLPHITGRLFKYDISNKLIGACALGQGLYNTYGSANVRDSFPLEKVKKDYTHICSKRLGIFTKESENTYNFAQLIIHLNDHHRFNLKTIASIAREAYADMLDTKLTFTAY